MSRLTDNDRHLGPITYGRSSWRAWRFIWSEEITAYAFGIVARLPLPRFIRLRGDYGVSLCEGFFNIYYGTQTMDSSTEKRWGYFLPWTQWRFHRISLYGLNGELAWSELASQRVGYDARRFATDLVEKRVFELEDFDGKRITATTYITEREWRFGTGWFKWLSWFRKPRLSRALDISFSEEVGRSKGSWKGGTIGHGIEMLPGELHEAAFRRYCDKEHKSRDGAYSLKFIGEADIGVGAA